MLESVFTDYGNLLSELDKRRVTADVKKLFSAGAFEKDLDRLLKQKAGRAPISNQRNFVSYVLKSLGPQLEAMKKKYNVDDRRFEGALAYYYDHYIVGDESVR